MGNHTDPFKQTQEQPWLLQQLLQSLAQFEEYMQTSDTNMAGMQMPNNNAPNTNVEIMDISEDYIADEAMDVTEDCDITEPIDTDYEMN